jgi:hypothetical protein
MNASVFLACRLLKTSPERGGFKGERVQAAKSTIATSVKTSFNLEIICSILSTVSPE